MPSIRNKLATLPASELAKLNYAFEHGLGQYIETGDNTFVGVNVGHFKHLDASETVGHWSHGIIKGE